MTISASGPKQRYSTLIAAGAIQDDTTQYPALEALELLYRQLRSQRSQRELLLGLYLWGSVGRGKTFLMDQFVLALGPDICLRQHFHHFMADMHRQLTALSGQKDPLRHIAKRLSQQTRVLCFDEFFVSDIGDAMLLGNLLQRVLSHGVILVATSNTPVERLYWNGLQRERFLPAIRALQTHTLSLHLSGAQDHRELCSGRNARFLLEPEDAAARHALRCQMLQSIGLSTALIEDVENTSLILFGRRIRYVARGERVICFDFAEVCEGPRSHFDYIEIARQFDTVLLFGLPRLSGVSYERIKARGTEDGALGSGETGARQVVLAPRDDAARRFIALIDEFYERRLTLIITSVAPLEEIYIEGSLTFEFQRARSRLIEMGAESYRCRR